MEIKKKTMRWKREEKVKKKKCATEGEETNKCLF
jgi:hypothetical protein